MQLRSKRALALVAVLAASAGASRHASADSVAGNVLIGTTAVFDPKLVNTDGSATTASIGGRVETASTRTYSAELTITDANGSVVRRLPTTSRTTNTTWWTSWNGANDQGTLVAPGRYTVRLTASGEATGTNTRAINIVRLGARALKFLDAGTTRIPMAYHAADGTSRSYFAIDSAGAHWTLAQSSLGAGALDDSTGRALAGPAPWTNSWAPPLGSNGFVVARGRSLPVAYKVGSRPNIQLTLGDRAVSKGAAVGCGYPIPGVSIRLRAGGGVSSSISPGGTVTVDLAALPAGLGRQDKYVEIRFEYSTDGGASWYSVPGRQATRHQIYTLLGTSKLSPWGTASNETRELPFVAAVDEATVSFAWGATTSATALDGITRAVYSKKNLTYDVEMGSSAYWDGGDLQSNDFAFADFLTNLSRGRTVNCSDCANIVSTYSRSIGVDMKIAILESNFRLNYIKGIGSSLWKKDIFIWGGDTFSYHAVGTVSNGATVHDACLAVDDGPAPWTIESRVERLPVDMPLDRYREKLSPDWFSVTATGRCVQY